MESVIVLDYGFGNVRSVIRALAQQQVTAKLSNDFSQALNAKGLIIPGVGAFSSCMQGLNSVRAAELVDKRLLAERPILGICVGMQVMFETGIEFQITTEGLAQWPGTVERLNAPVLPHMGFNNVRVESGSKMFSGIENEQFYFLHSYAVRNLAFKSEGKIKQPLVHRANYHQDFVAAIEDGSLWATQFHPEKSGRAGLQLIRNWLDFIDE